MTHWRIELSVMRNLRTIATALCIAWALPSCTESREVPGSQPVLSPGHFAVSQEELAARVDGVPITLGDVRSIMSEHPEPLTSQQALEVAIRTELLAALAKKRGYESSDEAKSARRAAMARVLLERRIGEGLGPSDVPVEVVKNTYERQKERFVHGVQRRVAHILVRGKKDLDGARRLAEQIYAAAQGAGSLEAFEGVYEDFAAQNNKKGIKLETLLPFDKNSKNLVFEFVGATFAVPKVGMVSKPALTEFGYHVIFVIEELPAQNVSFEEARPKLEEALLPELKRRRARQLEHSLKKEGDVFIFEDVLPLLEATP